jgi:hypothetical protein
MRTRALLPLAALLLAGCATPYQHSSNWGGFEETPGPGNLYSINFSGNMFVSDETAQKYVLHRAAEIAVQKGKSHFMLYEGLAEAATGRAAALPRTVRVHNGSVVSSFVLPVDGPRERSFDARAVLHQLREQANPKAANLQFQAAALPPAVAPGMVNVQVTGTGRNRICQDDKWVTLTPVEVGAARFIQVPAGKPISLQRLFMLTYGSCEPGLSFFPKADQSYAFNVAVSPGQGRFPQCAIELVRNDRETAPGVRPELTQPQMCR